MTDLLQADFLCTSVIFNRLRIKGKVKKDMLSPALTSKLILVYLSFSFTSIPVGNSHNCNNFPVSLTYQIQHPPFPWPSTDFVDTSNPSEVKLLPLALPKALKALVSFYSGQTRIVRTKAQCENGLLNSLKHTYPET